MKLLKRNLIFLYLCFFMFQNCAPFESLDDTFFYTYQSRPDFFADFKLVETEQRENDGTQLFNFDLAVSYATNPAENLGYRVDFSTIAQSGICSFSEGLVNNTNNHVQVQCILPVDVQLFVRVMLRGVNGEQEEFQYSY
ncbi:MAG: hypothetical protein MJK18_05870 [Bdellovibrionales bacterium]|nr:hypothetical protein [Bdellovibrionales bacterium]